MKRLIVSTVLALVALAVPGSPASKTETDILALMKTWREAMLKRNAGSLEKLYHQDLTYSHSNGKTETKQEAIEAAAKGPNVTEAIEIGDMGVRVYGNTALAKGNLRITTKNGDAAPQTVNLSVLHVWLKTPQGWQLVARQATRLNS